VYVFRATNPNQLETIKKAVLSYAGDSGQKISFDMGGKTMEGLVGLVSESPVSIDGAQRRRHLLRVDLKPSGKAYIYAIESGGNAGTPESGTVPEAVIIVSPVALDIERDLVRSALGSGYPIEPVRSAWVEGEDGRLALEAERTE